MALVRWWLLSSLCLLLVAGRSAGQDSENIRVAEGFSVEQIYRVPREQGSWVSMTSDPKGRLIVSDQYGKLYRINVAGAVSVEPIPVNIGFAQGLLCAFDSLYVMAHEDQGRPAGLYRVRDTDQDDVYDSVKLLRQLQGGGEHGPHAIILSHDKKSLLVCAGNHTDLTDVDKTRVPPFWDEDQLLPRINDPGGHAVGRMAPGGWICQTDPDGKSWELISCGFRNQYDIALDPNGELFSYDADMEWDIGTPWYRPTRVCHAVSGSEFGWRHGNYKWPDYYADSLPSVVDIGPGSPTGIVFGTGAKFPEKYQRALYICDWSYGIVYAVHLTAAGATFRGEAETFCSAPAMQAADIVVNADGNLYFVTGGRHTASRLYRISYRGAESTDPVAAQPPTAEAGLRQRLESFHQAYEQADEAIMDEAFAHLNHSDRFVRFAARATLERQNHIFWVNRLRKATDSWTILESVMALARINDQTQHELAFQRLAALDWNALTDEQKLHLIRDCALLWLRAEGAPRINHDGIAGLLNDKFPSGSELIDRELCRVLAAIDAPNLVPRALPMLLAANTQEDQIHYAAMLRVCRQSWTPDLRRKYFEWFAAAESLAGGNSFNGYIKAIRDEAVAALSPDERTALRDILDRKVERVDPYAELKARPVVQKWSVADFAKTLEDDLKGRDFENGKKIFTLAQCFKCHRMERQGGFVGPDLAGIGRRYSRHDLLESLIDPNKVISDQYQSTKFLMADGKTVVGRVVNLNGNDLMVQTDMINPANLTIVKSDQIDEQTPSQVSMMPEDLLNTLTRDEILDLMAYIRSDGNREFEELKQD